VPAIAVDGRYKGSTMVDAATSPHGLPAPGGISEVTKDALDIETSDRGLIARWTKQHTYAISIGQEAANEVRAEMPGAAGDEIHGAA
jgi:hypothetical protein